MDENSIKQIVGQEASKLVFDGMLVGLGTGTTATPFIECLAKRCRDGLKITAVATSNRSFELAKKLGIPMANPDDVSRIDLTIDGADEIDSEFRLLKGGGGALLREKILATSSKEMIVIAHEKKLVQHLGAFGLPVEIVPFCYKSTLKKIESLGFKGKLRLNHNSPYVTDNHNYIVDISFSPYCADPEGTDALLRRLCGVVETGFFFGIAKRILIGYADGSTRMLTHVR